MADSCTLTLHCPIDDASIWTEVGLKEFGWDGSGSCMETDSARWALVSERAQLASEGQVFYGSNGDSGEIDATVFASDGARYIELMSVNGGFPCVDVVSSGRLDQAQFKEARLYYSILKRAQRIIAKRSKKALSKIPKPEVLLGQLESKAGSF